ncbi:hypothetical protein V6N11_031263 [Hibiscus sabdariffa]|uniref:RNase H type-1 domain-containing protein n=1 Tax=Hibiscus sabdariffa TaxID=183260 RepID=A0ABR2SX66_9ROSI
MAQKSVEQGGLGFRDLHLQNRVFMMKVRFRLITDEGSLWIRVLKSKYPWKEVLPLSIKRSGCSRLCTSLCSIWEDLKECIHWEVRDGKDTDFWYDHWLGKENRLVSSCSGSTSPRPLRVVDMVSANGVWDWDSLEAILPKEKLDLIASIPPPQSGVGVDTPGDSAIWKRIWKLECMGGLICDIVLASLETQSVVALLLSRWYYDWGWFWRRAGLTALVRAILRLLNRDWSVEVHHIAHASNGIADKLAKQGRELGMESTLFATAPVEVVGLVEVEQRDSSPVTALSSTIAQEVIVDLGGTTFI